MKELAKRTREIAAAIDPSTSAQDRIGDAEDAIALREVADTLELRDRVAERAIFSDPDGKAIHASANAIARGIKEGSSEYSMACGALRAAFRALNSPAHVEEPCKRCNDEKWLCDECGKPPSRCEHGGLLSQSGCPDCPGPYPDTRLGRTGKKPPHGGEGDEAQERHKRLGHSASESFTRCPDPGCQINAAQIADDPHGGDEGDTDG